MAAHRRIGWTKRSVRFRDETFQAFEQLRNGKGLDRTSAIDQAMREWTERQAATGDAAELIAPTLEHLMERQLSMMGDRMVKLMVKNGILATTAVELFLEQRRRNGQDTGELMQEIKDRVYRRWKDPRTFADTEPDPKSYGKEVDEG